MKVAWLQPVWSHYHLARAKAFQKANPQTELICLEVSDLQGEVNGFGWRIDDSLMMDHRHVLFPGMPYSNISPLQISTKVLQFLCVHNVEVLCLLGYAKIEILQIISLLKLKSVFHPFAKNIKLVLLSESKKDDFARRSISEFVKKLILKAYDSALVAGQKHKEYLLDLGVANEAIYLGYDVVDNSTFHPSRIRCLPRRLDKPYFLSINRFVDKKNLPFLIKAYADYRRKNDEMKIQSWSLVLCGDGNNKSHIQKQIQEYDLGDSICLTGFLGQSELLPYFAHANCFIHASTQEQWGLVVNEAMAAGLPVLVSNRCGCFEDLVLEDINGFGFDPYNQQQLTDLMLKMSSGTVDLVSLGQASLQHIQKYSPDYFAQGLKQAIDYALAHR